MYLCSLNAISSCKWMEGMHEIECGQQCQYDRKMLLVTWMSKLILSPPPFWWGGGGGWGCRTVGAEVLESTNCQLRARRALSIFKDVLLRTRRGLLLYKAYGSAHRLCTAIAPFWFSKEHLWIVIATFLLSTNEMKIFKTC